MAIKTKKIADLTTIETTNSFILGSQNGVTGKIPYSYFTTDVENIITAKIEELGLNSSESGDTNEAAITVVQSVSDAEVEEMRTEIKHLKSKVTELSIANATLTKQYTNHVSSSSDTLLALQESVRVLGNEKTTATSTCDCSEKLAALEARVASLEGFVQALQKDGYLTLKEIQRAAANACPICNHTHEETAE